TGLPSGLSISFGPGTGGTVSGSTSSRGPFSGNVTVTDAAFVPCWKQWSLDILDPVGVTKTLPAIAPYQNVLGDCTVGWPCSQGVSVFSGGVAPFAWSATGLPPGLSIRSGGDPDATPGY